MAHNSGSDEDRIRRHLIAATDMIAIRGDGLQRIRDRVYPTSPWRQFVSSIRHWIGR